MGWGFSLLYPSLALVVVERVGEARRGAALGAFTAFFDAGVGLGGPLAGAIAALAGYPAAFWVSAGLAALAAVIAARAARTLTPCAA
jgi:predicted MFS family arabinose efflux permease